MPKVKFGDVVREVKNKVDRDNNPYEYFLAGEHFDSERLKIPRRGEFAGSDVGPAFHRLFKPGQVLYGSRRTYLKKVGVPDFEGVTANTTFVLETKDETVLMQQLLPFLILSDGFTEYSVSHSKGSTNPYILFSDLAKYECEIPCIERQRYLVDVLNEAESLKERYRALMQASDDIVKSRFVEMFGDPATNPFGFSTAGLTELGTCKNGMSFHSTDSGVELPCLGVADFKDLSFIDGVEGLSTVSLNERPSEDYLLNDGDIVFVRSNGNKQLVGRCLAIYPHGVDAVFSGFCIRLRLNNDDVRVPYLVWALKQPTIRSQMFGRGANVQNLNQKILSNVCVPIPSIEMQDEFLAFASQVDKSKVALQQSLDELNATMAAILNEELGTRDV